MNLLDLSRVLTSEDAHECAAAMLRLAARLPEGSAMKAEAYAEHNRARSLAHYLARCEAEHGRPDEEAA